MIRFSYLSAPAAILLAVATVTCAKQRSSEPRPLADFLISVTLTDAGIELTCAHDCAWKTLTFSARSGDQPVPVDRHGMTSTSTKGDPQAGDFLFTIQRTDKELRFQGLRGTAWTSLTIGCTGTRCSQSIDEYGTAAQ